MKLGEVVVVQDKYMREFSAYSSGSAKDIRLSSSRGGEGNHVRKIHLKNAIHRKGLRVLRQQIRSE
jgi:hypothetical protein